ncbi:hypothetical protein LEMLEM_LOCUS23325 [Lemmus lemmus]
MHVRINKLTQRGKVRIPSCREEEGKVDSVTVNVGGQLDWIWNQGESKTAGHSCGISLVRLFEAGMCTMPSGGSPYKREMEEGNCFWPVCLRLPISSSIWFLPLPNSFADIRTSLFQLPTQTKDQLFRNPPDLQQRIGIA